MHYGILLTGLICILVVAGCTSPLAPPPTTPTPQMPTATVTIQVPVSTSTIRTALPVTTPLITQLSGYGDDVRTLVTTGSGIRDFTMSNSGNSNFNVVLKDSHGTTIYFLTSAIGPYTGRISKPLDPGTYYLEITAKGPWTIEISPG